MQNRTFGPYLAGTLIGLLVVTRLFVAVGREHFVPPVFAKLSKRFGTPVITTMLLGVVTGASSSRTCTMGSSGDALLGHVFVSYVTPTSRWRWVSLLSRHP
jgi:amino acid transporter